MSDTSTIQSLPALKTQAKRLRAKLQADGHPVSHSQALEIIARQLGHKDWNTLYALAGNHQPDCPLVIGQGEVLGLVRLQTAGRFRVTIHFDDPVDVVTFDSFSAFRQRVSATMDRDGISPEKTGNGVPHLQLEL